MASSKRSSKLQNSSFAPHYGKGFYGINLQVNISNRQILGIALPITAAIIVPQINFITNNIFLGGLGMRALAWQVLRVYIT